MSNKKKTGILVGCIVIILCVSCLGIYLGVRFYKHEMYQQDMIRNLQLLLSQQEARITMLENKISEKPIEWGEDSFNYLAIGNSITKHGLASYWWDDDRGMASSKDDADYVHLVSEYLKENNSNVVTHSYNFLSWEVNAADRAEFLELLDTYLSVKIDLITIQLGENASELSTWESDFEDLITYVKNKSPNADIVVVGDFWSNGERDALKQQAAQKCGVMYASLDGMKDNVDYYAGLGTLVEGSDGEMHSIEHNGVALHPGDKGMESIAGRIIEKLNK